MAIENRDLPAGTRLAATYKKVRYICSIEKGEDGKTVFVLEDGKRFKSPSSAASAVMGGSAANGWKFWSLDWKNAAAGEHTLTSRAIDVKGRVQPAPDDPFITLKKTYWEANQQWPRRFQV